MTQAVTVEASGLWKVFPDPGGGEGYQAVRDVSLATTPAEMVAIVGPSGAGKSTLLYCLAGLLPATRGSASVLNVDTTTGRRRALGGLRRDHLGFIFQAYNLIPSLSAQDNVELPVRLKQGKAGARKAAQAALAYVGLSAQSAHLPGQLSGGQRQRVAIARIVATQPAVIFADEPTGALDQAAGRIVIEALRHLANSGSTVVLVTHDLDLAARADRVFVMVDGQFIDELNHPSPEHILARQNAGQQQRPQGHSQADRLEAV
jgi:putative ABC transport system ATP-binding protein